MMKITGLCDEVHVLSTGLGINLGINLIKMNTILVLTDFSDSALNAACYAARLAGTFDNCRIILYHSFPILPIDGLLSDPMDMDTSLQESKNKLRDVEISMEPFLKTGTRIESRTDSKSLTHAAEMIARSESVDLVIAGSKGHSITDRLLFGSNTGDLINKFPFPLLVIPPDAIYEPVQLAVFACELKDVESIPINTIRSIIRHFNCKLYILNVDTHKQDKIDTQTILQQEKLHELMVEVQPEYHYTNHPDIAEGIKEFTDKHQIGLLVVIHKKHGFFHNLIQGSTTKKLAMHAAVPLLVLKEEASSQATYTLIINKRMPMKTFESK